MSEWKVLVQLSSLSEGEPKGLRLDDRRIALYMINGEIFATDDACPHAFVRLSTGFLDEYVIECPLHGARFDVRTGRCECVIYRDVRTYPVEVRDGEVVVDLD